MGVKMSDSVKYLKKREWSMGNGQCPECCGVNDKWLGHPCYLTSENIGHEKDCSLAKALIDAGESPLIHGEFKSDIKYECFISEDGMLGTRIKTNEGCKRYKALVGRLVGRIERAA